MSVEPELHLIEGPVTRILGVVPDVETKVARAKLSHFDEVRCAARRWMLLFLFCPPQLPIATARLLPALFFISQFFSNK
jgi:hypothetical protein